MRSSCRPLLRRFGVQPEGFSATAFRDLSIHTKGYYLVGLPLIMWGLLSTGLVGVSLACDNATETEQRQQYRLQLFTELSDDWRDLVLSVRNYRMPSGTARNRIRELMQSIAQRTDTIFAMSSTSDTSPALKSRYQWLRQESSLMRTSCERLLLDIDEDNDQLHRATDLEGVGMVLRAIKVSAPQLTELVAYQRRTLARSQETGRNLRTTLLVAITFGVFVNVLLSLFLIRRFGEDVVNRLQNLENSSVKIAKGEELAPPEPGCDEIAQLGQVLFDVTRQLRERTMREKTIVSHAHDLIFLLADDLKVLTANPAAEKLLGITLSGDSVFFQSLLTSHARHTLESSLPAMRIGEVTSTNLEIEFLSQSVITQMAVSRAEKDQHWIVVARNITEIREMEQARQEFVNIVSHDIRSPLTVLSFSLDKLLESDLSATGRKLVENSRRNLSYVLDLVNNLLDLAKIDSGRLNLQRGHFVSDLPVLEAMQICEPLAKAKGLVIDFDTLAVVPVYADLSRITQVLQNLLSNAIKFSDDSSLIQIESESDGVFVTYRVRDWGPGVDAQSALHLFDRFWQLKQSSEASKGSGLGLSICKMIVEAHHGRIGYLPAAIGSTFWFCIPLTSECGSG